MRASQNAGSSTCYCKELNSASTSSLRSGSTMTPKKRQGQDQDPTASTCISANAGPQFITYINSKMEEQSEVLVPHTRVGTSQIPRKGDISPSQKG